MELANDFTEKNLTKQITENVQAFYERSGIDEKANVIIEVKGTGMLVVSIHTNALLNYDSMRTIGNIVFMLTPPGIMHDVVNLSCENSKTLTSGPKDAALFIDENSEKREFANIDTSTDVTMPVSKRKTR
jgi:hypothetical protein